jgi:hypothetical protein
MTTHLLELGSGLSTNEAREYPCQAKGVGPHVMVCGATPASLWERYCNNGHSRDVRLCPSHAVIFARGNGACSECLDKGTTCVAQLRPKDLILLGHIGE